jgi:hypothetical protein
MEKDYHNCNLRDQSIFTNKNLCLQGNSIYMLSNFDINVYDRITIDE